ALRCERPDIYKLIRVTMYCSSPIAAHLLTEPCLTVKENIGKEVFQMLDQSHGCLVFLPPHKKDELTTKFAEYLATEKPILIWSESGYASQFVEEHMLGYHMDGNAAGWIAFYEAWKNGKPPHATQTIVDAFSLNQMAEKLIRLLH
ncbi:MAG: glycosyltransferase, partial [Flavobacteriales bacterium]